MISYTFCISASLPSIAGGTVSTLIRFEPGFHPPVPAIGDDLVFRKNGRLYLLTIENRAFTYGVDLEAEHIVVGLMGPTVEC
jgi:hypothetical protein